FRASNATGFFGRLNPVRTRRQDDGSRPYAADGRVYRIGRRLAGRLELPRRPDHLATSPDHHAVRGAQVLLGPVVDRFDAVFVAHELGHRPVLQVAGKDDAAELQRLLQFEVAHVVVALVRDRHVARARIAGLLL